MAIKTDFSNTVADKKEKKKVLKELTVLEESDKNTIYNMIFSEKSDQKEGQNS